jgi:two-component system chemotaxis sensor kinase CheA
MKGAARAVDVEAIETACHGLEEILAGARDGTHPLDVESFRVLFATTDAIQDAGLRLKQALSPDEPRLRAPVPAPSTRIAIAAAPVVPPPPPNARHRNGPGGRSRTA